MRLSTSFGIYPADLLELNDTKHLRVLKTTEDSWLLTTESQPPLLPPPSPPRLLTTESEARLLTPQPQRLSQLPKLSELVPILFPGWTFWIQILPTFRPEWGYSNCGTNGLRTRLRPRQHEYSPNDNDLGNTFDLEVDPTASIGDIPTYMENGSLTSTDGRVPRPPVSGLSSPVALLKQVGRMRGRRPAALESGRGRHRSQKCSSQA